MADYEAKFGRKKTEKTWRIELKIGEEREEQ